jgi:hypothetical protein
MGKSQDFATNTAAIFCRNQDKTEEGASSITFDGGVEYYILFQTNTAHYRCPPLLEFQMPRYVFLNKIQIRHQKQQLLHW